MSETKRTNHHLNSSTKKGLVQSIVNSMDPATLWRWNQAIKERLRSESINQPIPLAS